MLSRSACSVPEKRSCRPYVVKVLGFLWYWKPFLSVCLEYVEEWAAEIKICKRFSGAGKAMFMDSLEHLVALIFCEVHP